MQSAAADLDTVMRAFLAAAGAQRGVLLVAEGDPRGEARRYTAVHAAPEGEGADFPAALAAHVERTGERVVLGEAPRETFASDGYLARVRPASALCLPLTAGGKSVAVLYLEAARAPGAFTPDRCRAVDLLAPIAGLALERVQRCVTQGWQLSEGAQRLKDAQARLISQERLASLGALVSGIAHEIKNPLNFINNFADISAGLTDELLQELGSVRLDAEDARHLGEVVDDLRRNLTRIHEHGQRVDRIVRTILQQSRTPGGDRREVDLNALVTEYVNLAYQGFRSRDPSFNVPIAGTYDASVSALNVAPQEIGRVLLNLVNNACYAVEAQKRLRGEPFSPSILVSTREQGDRVEIRVRDNGAGIPAAVRERLFTPFFTTKPAGEGTGLGLSISRDIVQEHGGSLSVSTEEGQFTEFVITLPRHPPR